MQSSKLSVGAEQHLLQVLTLCVGTGCGGRGQQAGTLVRSSRCTNLMRCKPASPRCHMSCVSAQQLRCQLIAYQWHLMCYKRRMWAP